jgi:DivIVA domain-containing protein
MPLTPEDVNNKRFTPVRLREGYDMGEVDQFLDEVAVELTRLIAANDELRAKLASASTATPGTAAPTPAVQAKKPEPVKPPEPTPAPAAPTTITEASGAAARLLEIAGQNADQLVAEAQDNADKIVGEARTKAERLEAEAKSKAERLESDARSRSESLDAETSERRNHMFGQLEKDKETLTRELEDLRSFEREYRSRLKAYFQSQLQALDGEGDGEVPLSPSQDGETPRRLRELLGEEGQPNS